MTQVNKDRIVNYKRIAKELYKNIDKQWSNNLILVIDGAEELGLWCKEFNTPSLSSSSTELGTGPGGQSNRSIKIPGGVPEIGEISLTLFCDEELILYEKIFDLWLRQNFENSLEHLLHGSILFMNNTKRHIRFIIEFGDGIITDIGSMNYSTGSKENLLFDLTLEINTYHIHRNLDGF